MTERLAKKVDNSIWSPYLIQELLGENRFTSSGHNDKVTFMSEKKGHIGTIFWVL